nr:hypothetical protein [Selenomonas ruminantium]
MTGVCGVIIGLKGDRGGGDTAGIEASCWGNGVVLGLVPGEGEAAVSDGLAGAYVLIVVGSRGGTASLFQSAKVAACFHSASVFPPSPILAFMETRFSSVMA